MLTRHRIGVSTMRSIESLKKIGTLAYQDLTVTFYETGTCMPPLSGRYIASLAIKVANQTCLIFSRVVYCFKWYCFFAVVKAGKKPFTVRLRPDYGIALAITFLIKLMNHRTLILNFVS